MQIIVFVLDLEWVFAESYARYVKLRYFATILSLVTLQSNVRTHVRWNGLFSYTVQHWLLQLCAKSDGNLWITFKVIAKKTFALLFCVHVVCACTNRKFYRCLSLLQRCRKFGAATWMDAYDTRVMPARGAIGRGCQKSAECEDVALPSAAADDAVLSCCWRSSSASVVIIIIIIIITSCRLEAITICPRSCDLDIWPFDLESGVRVTCYVGYLCANFSLPRPLCSRLRPDVRDRRQTDRRHTASSLNAPA